MSKRNRALKSKGFLNRASKEVTLRKLRPLFPQYKDESLWEMWQACMDTTISLISEGYGVGIQGVHQHSGILHPQPQASRRINNLASGGIRIIPPRVLIRFTGDKEFLENLNNREYSDLNEIRPDLFEA